MGFLLRIDIRSASFYSSVTYARIRQQPRNDRKPHLVFCQAEGGAFSRGSGAGKQVRAEKGMVKHFLESTWKNARS